MTILRAVPRPPQTVEELLRLFGEIGLRLLFWERTTDPAGWKAPSFSGWNDKDRVYDLRLYDPNRHNLGTFLGHEIAPGRFVADVDFDWTEGLPLAKLLPPTTLDSGAGVAP